MEFISFRIAFGQHPKNDYTQASIRHLCNVYPKLPVDVITYYLDNYSGLMIPTYRSFKVFLKEVDGKIFMNNAEIQQQIPPHAFVPIDCSDECFLEDMQILNDKKKLKTYVEYYATKVAPELASRNQPLQNQPLPNQPQQDNAENNEEIDCSECICKKPENGSVSCSGGHIICQTCLRKQANRILHKKTNVMEFICKGGSDAEPCLEQFDRGDLERGLADAELFRQLVALGVFEPKNKHGSAGSSQIPRMEKEKEKEKRREEQSIHKLSMRELNERGWLCPITRKPMKNPVLCEDGFLYDLEAIRDFYNEFRMSAMTYEKWDKFVFNPDTHVQLQIASYLSIYPEDG